jgi:hypothetical protein
MGADVKFPDGYKNAQVVTSDGKKIGTVKSIDSNSLVVFKKGLIRNEEFHIPTIAVSHYVSRSGKDTEDNRISKIRTDSVSIKLNLSENEVKHGYEFVGDNKPNSNLVSGKTNSGYNIGLKETVRYEALVPNSEKILDPAISTDKLPSEQEYICACKSFIVLTNFKVIVKIFILLQQEFSRYIMNKVKKKKTSSYYPFLYYLSYHICMM